MRRLAVAGLVLLLAACRGGGSSEKADEPEKGKETPSAPTPVRVAQPARANLPLAVSAPGHTAALTQQKLRPPFAGTIVELKVVDGDIVSRGQTVGAIVSRESEAARSGARQMQREAATPAERADADRAVALAEKNLVRKPLVASWDGAVVSHAASAGDRVAEDQEILTIADAASIVFLADVGQAELSRIRPGQKVTVALAGSPAPVPGLIHSVLPGANPADFTGPVRVDLQRGSGRIAIGLFGTARILVGERPNATVVPDAAVLRDDVTGDSRICLVADGKAHWVKVTPGVRDSGRTEIVSPPLPEGQPVVVSGLVGLPEGKPVAIER